MLKKIGVRNTIIYLILIFILYITFGFRIPVKTETAKYTTYEDKVSFRGIYIAKEQVVYTGDVKNLGILYVENGERVSKGAKISKTLNSNSIGVVLNNVDGYENKYDIENIKSLSIEEMDTIINNKSKNQGLKIIESETLYLYVFVDKEGSFKKGDQLNIDIEDHNYTCSVIDSVSKKEGNFLILKLIEDLNYKNLHRGIRGDIIKSSHKGILVPSKCIKIKGDNHSVFVKESNGYTREKNVQVLYDDGKNAVIAPIGQNTIKEYDEIITSPIRFIKDGTKVS